MSFIYFFVYILLVAVIIFDIYLGIKSFEYIYCASIRHQPPLVASNQHERQLVVDQIKTKYPEAKNICELGSGFGGLARTIARNTKANVYELENMPFSAFVSKTCDILLRCKNNHTIFGDAFEYLKTTNKHFDIAVAYLGPTATPMIYKYKNKINVLISLDFEIKELKPKYVIDMGRGYTIYKRIKYPHRLFIYEFK